MLADLTTSLERFLNTAVPGGSKQSHSLASLIEHATLLTLLEPASAGTLDWLRLADDILAEPGESAASDDVLWRLQIAMFAVDAPTAHENTIEEIEDVIRTIHQLIDALHTAGAVQGVAIGSIAAGHIYLYAREPGGFRAGLLEDAQTEFAAVEQLECDPAIRAFARMRNAESRMVAIRNTNSADLIKSHEEFADALHLLDTDTGDIHPAFVLRLRTHACAALGTSSYVLSTLNSEYRNQMLDSAIPLLQQAIETDTGLQSGTERWAKAALSLALAWYDKSSIHAERFAATGVLGPAFDVANDNAKGLLADVVNRAFAAAPEIWAVAHWRLGSLWADDASADPTPAVLHLAAAQSVFTEQECPETWSIIERSIGALLLNRALLAGDALQTEEAIRHFRIAMAVHDPMRDTERNACMQLANALSSLQRWNEALAALSQAADAAQFIVARATTAAAQRAEFGIFADILKRTAALLLKRGDGAEAARALVFATECDFTYELLFEPASEIPQEQLLDRILLSQTAVERGWNQYFPFARTERELNAIRINAGTRLASVVREEAARRRGMVAERVGQLTFDVHAPAGGALVIPLATASGATFIVLFGDYKTRVELVPAPYSGRGALLEAVFGTGLRDGWLGAYQRSAAAPDDASSFAGFPAVATSKDRVLSVSFLPGPDEDPSETVVQQLWVPALDDSCRAAWHIVEPLHCYLKDKLSPGSPVVFVGEPLLAMLPLSAAWRHENEKPRDLVEEWSIGFVPAVGVLPVPPSEFRYTAGSAGLIVVDPTQSLAFAEWEYVAAGNLAKGTLRTLSRRRNGVKRALLETIQELSILHFACHARYDNDEPLESHIDLGEGETLSAREIVKLKLPNLKLVVLSACESGMHKTAATHPGRYIGLATAFLQAGAQRVVSTLWTVNDVSTMLLMHSFYKALVEGPPILALRNAQLAIRDMTASGAATALGQLLKDAAELPKRPDVRPKTAVLNALIQRFSNLPPTSQPFRHAYHWAAFVYYGVPR